MPQDIPPAGRFVIDVPSRVVIKVLFVAAMFWLAINVLADLSGLLIQMSVAIFLAVAADPLIRRLERRGVSRGRSVAVIMLGVLAVIALFIAVFVPPLVEQGSRLTTAAPGIIDDVRSSTWYARVDEQFGIIETISTQAEKLPGIVSQQLTAVLGAVAAGVFGTITILFLTVLLLTGGGGFVEGAVRLVPQIAERRWWSIIQGAYSGIAAYVGGAVVIALIGGSVVTVTALLLGLPYALPLGLWMLLLEVIPMIGATIGAIPAILVAFVSGGIIEGVIMLSIVVVYQQVENIVIQPRVQGKAAKLSALAVFIAVLIGSQLLGILGALFAVPAAGVLQIFLRQVIHDSGTHEMSVPALAPDELPEPPDLDEHDER